MPENGVSIVVTTRNDFDIAKNLAEELARLTWMNREFFVRQLTPFDRAIEIAQNQNREPVIFSTPATIPEVVGLEELRNYLPNSEKVSETSCGSFFDQKLAEEAMSLGLGSKFKAVFNRDLVQNQQWQKYDDLSLLTQRLLVCMTGRLLVG